VINGQRSSGGILLDGAENVDLFTATWDRPYLPTWFRIPQSSRTTSKHNMGALPWSGQRAHEERDILIPWDGMGYNRVSAYTANTFDNDRTAFQKAAMSVISSGTDSADQSLKTSCFSTRARSLHCS